MKIKPLLLILFALLMYHATLSANNVLPVLVKDGEAFDKRENFYIPTSSPIKSIAINPNGEEIVSGSADGSIKIWNLKTGKLLKSLEGHTRYVGSIAISPNGEKIVSGSGDESIKIWNLKTGKLLKRLEGHTRYVGSIAISPNGEKIVSGSGDGSIKIWNLKTGKLLKSLEGHNYSSNIAISPNGEKIVSGSNDKSIKIWNLKTGKFLKSLEGHKSDINSIAFSLNGEKIVSGLDDGSIKIWNLNTGKLLKILEGHSDSVNSIAISPNGEKVVSCSDDGSIKIWNLNTGKLLKSLEGHTNNVNSVAISLNGKIIVSGSRDSSIKIWDSSTGKLFKNLSNNKEPVHLVFRNKNFMVSSPDGHLINIWNLKLNKMIKVLNMKTSFRHILITSNGTKILLVNDEGEVRLLDTKTSKIIQTLYFDHSNISYFSISSDEKIFFIASGHIESGKITASDISTGKLLREWKFSKDKASSKLVSLSQDGRLLVIRSKNNTMEIVDTETAKVVKKLNWYNKNIIGSILSPKKDFFVQPIRATGSMIKNIGVELIDTETGQITHRLRPKRNFDGINFVEISSDGKLIVLGLLSSYVEIWSTQTGKLLKTLDASILRRSKFILSEFEESKRLIVIDFFGRIREWDIQRGKKLKEFISGKNATWLVFDYKKKKLFRGDDGTLLYHKDGENLKLALPKLAKEDKVHLNTKGVSVVNEQSKSFLINVTNVNNEKLYWIKNAYYSDEYCHLLEYRTSNIEAHENGDLNLSIDVTLPKLNPKPINNHSIKLKFFTATGSEFNLSVPISIRYADINITKAEVSKDGKNLNIEIKNIGNETLKNAKVKLTKPFVANIQDLLELNASATQAFSYVLPLDENKKPIELNEKDILNVTVFIPNVKLEKENPKAEVAPAYVWQRENVPIVLNKLALYVYALWALAVLVLLWLIWYLRRYKNPLVVKLSKEPKTLLELKPSELKNAKQKLENIGRFKSTLSLAELEEKAFNEALAFVDYTHDQKANVFSQNIGVISCEKKGEFYQLKMGDDFNLSSLRNFLLYISDEPSQSIYKKLVGLNDKIFVLTSETEQNKMAKLAHEKSNRLLAPSLKELTAFLLRSDKEQEFISILSKCLLFKDVSPYQINGDVKNENNFFGRVEILREIISNNSANYLLVGARQLGKSSVLKALERRYEQNELCYYSFTLDESGDVMTALCKALKLAESSSLEQVVDAIKAEKQKVIFLIDEADKFVQNEKENGYLLTSVFRKLAQEGEAMFILAGFWTLDEYVTLDYQSPLKNFGKLIILGGLEKEACRELMLEPMKRIGIKYEDESIVEKTIALCGYRANYIATVCDVVLQSLERSIISQKDVDDALESDAIDKMLKGWGTMSANEKANRLDRLIVYMTIEKESFRLGDVVTAIKEKGLSIDTQKIDESLERLVLGYVVGKHKGNYTYRIPLLKERLLEEDLEFLIEGEILGLQ